MHEFDDWDMPFAYEGLARGYALHDNDQAKKHIQEARETGRKIEKEEDRAWLHTNLDEIDAMIDGA
jgi:glucose-6-phosphate isomerase